METLTAVIIAELAFKKFIESSAGELAKQFTSEAISKMDELRKIIWDKLRGNHKAESALNALENGKTEEFNRVSSYLQVAMDDDETFGEQVQQLANEINALKVEDNSSMTQINRDNSTGYQTKVNANTSFVGGTHHHGTYQSHSGSGDNINGNKIINNNAPRSFS